MNSQPLAYPRDRITAGILAGGRAVRMGGIDKGLVPLAGHCLAEYALAALRPQAARVLISANRNPARYARFGVEVVPDRNAGFLGPLAGMAGLMARAETEWLLTAPCDSPQIAADYGLRLWQAAARANADLAVAKSGGRMQPVFVLLRCALRDDLESCLAAGERKVERWIHHQRSTEVDFSGSAEMFVNVNTLAERDALAATLRPPSDPVA